MANIIKDTDFVGIWSLPNLDSSDNTELLNEFISLYEPLIAEKYFGLELYDNILTGINVVDPDVIDQIWIDLLEGKRYTDQNGSFKLFQGLKIMLINLIFIQWISKEQSMNTELGETQLNKSKTSPYYRIVTVQQSAANINLQMRDFIEYSNYTSEVYEGYIYGFMPCLNALGI